MTQNHFSQRTLYQVAGPNPCFNILFQCRVIEHAQIDIKQCPLFGFQPLRQTLAGGTDIIPHRIHGHDQTVQLLLGVMCRLVRDGFQLGINGGNDHGSDCHT